MDAWLYRQINRLADHTGWLHGLVIAYAKYGVALFGLLLVMGWLRARSTGNLRAEAGLLWAGGGTLMALAVAQAVGHAVDRGRPYTAMPHAHVLISKTTDFSFPSDHSTTVGAVAIGLLLVDRTLGRVAVALAVLMAIARVYVGVHYPGDVLGGLALGGAVILAVARPATRLVEAILHRVSRLPGVALITGRPKAGAGQPA